MALKLVGTSHIHMISNNIMYLSSIMSVYRRRNYADPFLGFLGPETITILQFLVPIFSPRILENLGLAKTALPMVVFRLL